MEAFRRDLRTALRSLLRSPSFSLAALVALALGIGATTAIFTVLDRVALRPLAYPDADRLVWIDSRIPEIGPDERWGVSQAGYHHFREHNRTFQEIGVYGTDGFTLIGEDKAERVETVLASASLLRVLGAHPAHGRLFTDDDNRPEGPIVAVLNHDYWKQRFGGDPGVVGTTVRVEGMPVEIVGVVAAGFHLPDQREDLWLSLPLDPNGQAINDHSLSAVGRLRPGASPEDAERDLARLTSLFPELFPSAYSRSFMDETGFATQVTSLRDFVIGDMARVLWLLLGAVGLVLLIACANAANLFLVRAEGRRRESAVRAALGASRVQLLRLFLSEGFLLAGSAGVIGLWMADLGIGLLLAAAPASLPRLPEIALDETTVLFTLALSLATGAALGALPFLHVGDHIGALRDGGRGLTSSKGQSTIRSTLVIVQIALALVLLAAAGLMVRTFQELREVEPGFDPANVLAVELNLPFSKYSTYEDVARFYRRLTDEIEALPGVVSVGASQDLPLKNMEGCSTVMVEGRILAPDEEPPCIGTTLAAPGFFRTLGIPVAGGVPDWTSTEDRVGEVVVTRTLAERLWPGEEAIGKGIRAGSGSTYYRVIGVTGEIRGEGLDRPATEMVFFPMIPKVGAPLWSPPRAMSVVVRASQENSVSLAPQIRQVLTKLDPEVALGRVEAMDQIVARSISRVSFTMLLLGIAGVMALLLSAVGIYGVMAYIVAQRRSEIGIRMALGARGGQVKRLVVSHAARLAAVGIAAGMVGALAGTRLLRSLLFEVSPSDPLTLAAVSAVLAAVAITASYVPARRASRVDPAEILRAD